MRPHLAPLALLGALVLTLGSAAATHAKPAAKPVPLPPLMAPADIAPNPVAPADPDRLARTQAAAHELVEKRLLPGLRVAIIKDGARVAEFAVPDGEGCGDPKVAPIDCAYRIGSVTKVFTATLALRLATAERLDLDARVGRYVPEVTPAYSALTTRELLGHVSGAPHYSREDYFNQTRYASVVDSLKAFLDKPLVAAPGTGYHYSSYGYTLVGAVLERACGMPYLECLRQQVLAPLGLKSVSTESGALAPAAPHAAFLDRGADGAGFVPSVPIDLSDRWPAGALLASVADLARFGWAAQWSPLLDATAHAAIYQRQPLVGGGSSPVGLAWRITEDTLSHRMYAMSGDAVGGRTVIVIYPEEHLVVAMATNLSLAQLTEYDAAAIAAPWF